jgi:hypothetical protein
MKNSKNRISLLSALIFLLLITSNGHAQLIPSVYTGIGMGTNLGGMMGIGGEIQYKLLSFNVAVGNVLGKPLPEYHTGNKSKFDYDLGLKLYTKFGLFGGVNYGLIDAELYSKKDQDVLHFEKTHGFSFTLGYRHTIYKHLYGLTYLGLTSNKEVNYLFPPLFDKRESVLRIGLILGYEFNSISLCK